MNADTTERSPFLSVPLPVAHHDPWPVTWHKFTSRKPILKIPWTFFQASYRPHCSPTVSNNTQLRRNKRKRERWASSHSQSTTNSPQSNYRRTHPDPRPQPPSSYCLPQNYSHFKTTPHSPGSAVKPPMRNSSETAKNRTWEGYEAVSTAGDPWAKPRTVSSRQQFEGESESGARWALRGEFITKRRGISHWEDSLRSSWREFWNLAFERWVMRQ